MHRSSTTHQFTLRLPELTNSKLNTLKPRLTNHQVDIGEESNKKIRNSAIRMIDFEAPIKVLKLQTLNPKLDL